MNFGNIATAMVTPFDKNENIDFQKTVKADRLFNKQWDGFPGGCRNNRRIADAFRRRKGSAHSIFRKGSGRPRPDHRRHGKQQHESVDQADEKAEEAGADAVMLVTPYYNKPSQEGMYRHFRAIAEETSVPVMLYNVPGRTAASLAPETTIRLAEIPNIIAIKEASGDLDAITKS